jgi:hypothetical protein
VSLVQRERWYTLLSVEEADEEAVINDKERW